MRHTLGKLQQDGHAFDSDELKEAERFFEWARSYERKGLKIAADALRDEGRKAYVKFLSHKGSQWASQ